MSITFILNKEETRDLDWDAAFYSSDGLWYVLERHSPSRKYLWRINNESKTLVNYFSTWKNVLDYIDIVK